MEHKYNEELQIESGLALCDKCGLAEGSLTTDCPNESVMGEKGDTIYSGALDYRESDGWVNAPNPTNQSHVKSSILYAMKNKDFNKKDELEIILKHGIDKNEYNRIKSEIVKYLYS